MHVHYNTMKYRISRIKELTAIDFSDTDTVFHVLLSKKIVELSESMSDVDSEPSDTAG